jgi:hypothetical protein
MPALHDLDPLTMTDEERRSRRLAQAVQTLELAILHDENLRVDLDEVEGSEDEEPDDDPESDDRDRPQITHQNVDHAE